MTDAPELIALKQRMKSTWMAGDFGQIARLNEKAGQEFVGRLDLRPGMKVLDVACGTGNQSVPAAAPELRLQDSTSLPIFWSRPGSAPRRKI